MMDQASWSKALKATKLAVTAAFKDSTPFAMGIRQS
jgi:hypothetical protein